MSEEKSKTQPDKNLAAEERPVPSQAEGDLETVKEDLEDKDKEEQRRKK
jgi:hypothetical protein